MLIWGIGGGVAQAAFRICLRRGASVWVTSSDEDKLARARATQPLFDTARFTRNLEGAYRVMLERRQQGLAPASFELSALRAG